MLHPEITVALAGTTFAIHIADVHSDQCLMCTVHCIDVHGSPVRYSPSTVYGDVHRVYSYAARSVVHYVMFRFI